jgi:mRNA degradation ribonuclease J1/J2
VHFGLISKKSDWNHTHVSGHGDGRQIKQIIEDASTKNVVPVHTTKEKYHQRWHPKVRKVKVNGYIELW